MSLFYIVYRKNHIFDVGIEKYIFEREKKRSQQYESSQESENAFALSQPAEISTKNFSLYPSSQYKSSVRLDLSRCNQDPEFFSFSQPVHEMMKACGTQNNATLTYAIDYVLLYVGIKLIFENFLD
jgi:hypothetical protein